MHICKLEQSSKQTFSVLSASALKAGADGDGAKWTPSNSRSCCSSLFWRSRFFFFIFLRLFLEADASICVEN